jgi:hypothetical protein
MATAITALRLCDHSRSNLSMYMPPPPPTLILCVASLTSASKITIEGMLSYYGGQQPGQTPGVFNQIQGYYWWMAGAAWNVFSQLPLPTSLLKDTIGDHAILVVNRRCILQRSHHSGNAVLAPLLMMSIDVLQFPSRSK